ncbi:hypothetical protein BC829DRAFT_439985 [Chytridium lagenaria]|nr:hypothetical protein BC829DRAFT_439985 [Chytridium lagenaria]
MFSDHGLYTTVISSPSLTASPVSEQSICVEPTNNYSFERAEWDEYGGPLCTDNYREKNVVQNSRFDQPVAAVYPSPPSTGGKHHCVELSTRDSVECAKCIADLKGEGICFDHDEQLNEEMIKMISTDLSLANVPAYINTNVENVCAGMYVAKTENSSSWGTSPDVMVSYSLNPVIFSGYCSGYPPLTPPRLAQWAEFFADLKLSIYFDLIGFATATRRGDVPKYSTDLTSAKPQPRDIPWMLLRFSAVDARVILETLPTTDSSLPHCIFVLHRTTRFPTPHRLHSAPPSASRRAQRDHRHRPAVTLEAASNSKARKTKTIKLQKKLYSSNVVCGIASPAKSPQRTTSLSTQTPTIRSSTTPMPSQANRFHAQSFNKHAHTHTIPGHRNTDRDTISVHWLTGIDIVAKYSSFRRVGLGNRKGAVKTVKGVRFARRSDGVDIVFLGFSRLW